MRVCESEINIFPGMLQLLCPNGDCHSEISFENNNRRIMMSNTGDAGVAVLLTEEYLLT